MKLRTILFATSLAVACGPSGNCVASSDSRPAALSDNLRWTVDAAVRAIDETESGQFGHIEFLGVDLHKVFSNDKGDWGTLLFQSYLTRINNVGGHPPFFDSNYDTEIEWRIANMNFVVLDGGRLNLRVGHFEIPFGLEQIINTNGTLRDYIHGPNFGLKADWGVTANGELPAFEYELAVSRGSGNNWRNNGDPYIVSGRIGTPRDRNWWLGLSGFQGKVYDRSQADGTFKRSRVGVDGAWYWQQFGLLGEVSFGRDESRDVLNALVEADWSSRDDVWLVYLQIRRFAVDRSLSSGTDSAIGSALGATWDPDNHWSFGLQWSRDLKTFSGAPDTNVIAGQIRYRL
jgi:hypothetical protein